MIGTVFVWVLCFAMNFGRHAASAFPELSPISFFTATIVDIGYWILPKPVDMIVMVEEIVQAHRHQWTFSHESYLQDFDAGLSLFTSFLASCAIIGLAVWQLRKAEY